MQKKSIKVISFTGFDGGRSKKMSNVNLHVNSNNYGIIENLHHAYMNIISQFIKIELLSNKELKNINFKLKEFINATNKSNYTLA